MFNTYDETKPYYDQMDYGNAVLDRFWSKVNVIKLDNDIADTESCWEWTGCNSKSYGYFYNHRVKKCVLSHRFIYECFNGPIPSDMDILHKCDNTVCVNPFHLCVGSHLDNMRDKCNKNRQPKGSQIVTGKLYEKDIYNIIYMIYNNEYTSYKEIAKDNNVSVASVGDIVLGKTWGHLTKIICEELNCDLLFIKNKINTSLCTKNAKITKKDANEIRKRYFNDGEKQAKIANDYNIRPSTVSRILNNKLWK